MFQRLGLKRDPFQPVYETELYWESPGRLAQRRAAAQVLAQGRGLWIHGLVAFALGVAAIVVFRDAPTDLQNSMGEVLSTLCGLIFGVNGNRWRAERLMRKGYRPPEQFPAPCVIE